MHKVLGAVPSHLVAADFPVLHNNEAGTGKGGLRCYHSRFQCGSRRNNLKRGARLIGIVDAAVSPHGI